MRVYGIIGWKNSGKTTLMERLVACITARGFSVSTVKHVHHDVDLDQPGKDTFRHRVAGAQEVILASAHRFALMREHRGPEPELASIITRLAPVDLVLVEGYKRDPHRKIEVHRLEPGHPLIQPADPLIRAVATDASLPDLTVPVLDLNDAEAVADFILAETGLTAPNFDTVIIVDWSAAAKPTPEKDTKDAIWIGAVRSGLAETTYHRTRAAAEAYLSTLLDAEAAAGRRVLLGFDFPMGYPAGFAVLLTGQPSAKAVWQWLAKHISDDTNNANNRFQIADQINARLGMGGPFWGRPANLPLAHLSDKKSVDYPALGLAERREVEAVVPRAQPVWKLYTTGSVGSQSLMGLPLIHRLSQRRDVKVWPFDAPTGRLVIAEVYPSLLFRAVANDPGKIKDEAQVRLLALALWRLGQSGTLGPLFEVPSTAARREEGWILGAGHADMLEAALR